MATESPPLTYNGENDVSTFSQLFLVNEDMHKISDEFEFRPDQTLTTELAALSI